MSKLRPRRPSASMVVAVIALFVAMGGSSYAAITLGKNTVGSKQLKKNAVTTVKIKNGAVTGSKIKLATLGQVPSAKNAGTLGGVSPSGYARATLPSGATETGV